MIDRKQLQRCVQYNTQHAPGMQLTASMIDWQGFAAVRATGIIPVAGAGRSITWHCTASPLSVRHGTAQSYSMHSRA